MVSLIHALFNDFFPVDPSPQTLTVYTDNQGVAIEDVYSNANSFESQCASISGELHTFCIGGPQYFQNNTLLENSPSWGLINPAKDIHNTCIFRDTKHIYGSPLFRHHYECPTNPSLMHCVIKMLGGTLIIGRMIVFWIRTNMAT